MKDAWRVALHQAIEEHYIRRPSEWYQTVLSPVGGIDITIVSNRFERVPDEQRREEIEQLVHRFSPHTPIFFSYEFTVEEGYDHPPSRNTEIPIFDSRYVQSWPDLADYTANAIAPSKPRYEPRTPKTVAFYSLKGGVGRTTALVQVAALLTRRGRRVLVIDLDVASPGLGSLLGLDLSSVPSLDFPTPDLVHYFRQLYGSTEEERPTIRMEQLVREIPLQGASGQLFVVPTGDLASLDYLNTDFLDLDQDFKYGKKLWGTFYQEMTAYLHPDIILVDAHAGIDKWTSFALLHAADQALLFLYPDEQNLRGTRLIVKALGDLLPTHFVFSKVLTTNTRRMEILQQQWTILQAEKAESTFMSTNGHNPAAEASASAPLIIPYIPEILLAETYPAEELLSHYEALADLIEKGL